MNEKLEKILFISTLFFFASLPILGLWLWLNPIGFIQQLLTFILSMFLFIFLNIAILIFVEWVID